MGWVEPPRSPLSIHQTAPINGVFFMAITLARRSLLQGMLILPASLLGRVPSSQAPGGVLSTLHPAAPGLSCLERLSLHHFR